MNQKLIALALLSLTATATIAQEPEWQTIDAYRNGQIDSHALVVPYVSQGAQRAIADFKFEESPYYQSLNGKWKFNWVKGVDNRPVGFYADSCNVSSWADINVPGNWERQGYGTTVYTNTTYEFDSEWADFKKDWPRVPSATNEVGSYRRTFTVPEDWQGRRVVLCLEGVISFYYVWVNGQYLGCNMGSKDAAEFDVTSVVRPGENNISLEVYRWSSGAYFECQDFWRLSGIERDVYLYSTPKTYISDFTVRSPLDSTYTDGVFNLDVELANLPEPAPAPAKGKKAKNTKAVKPMTLAYTLYDADGNVTISGVEKAAPTLKFNSVIDNVKPWSAEHPNLYTLVVDLNDANGKPTHTVGCMVGFKTSEVKGDVWYFNGKPIKIKGTNRHTHSQLGRTVSRDTALLDIKIMKEHNINAVRNCHYPQDRYWYYLCDRYGIYLCDEANNESHGYGYGAASLAKCPEWIGAAKDRVMRMWHKSKNNPSVTFYSLGNECGNGIVMEEAYKWLKGEEPGRPVQYERALYDWNSDLFAEMYAAPHSVKRYAEDPKMTRPYILCEYAHGMGNSLGSLQDYWDVFEAYEQTGGGFTWDWVDQSFVETDKNGKRYFAYGGDYGPENVPTDDSFLCNGLITSVRTLHPHIAEVKKVYQYIKSQLVDTASLTVKIDNRMDFTNLDAYTLTWSVVLPDGSVVKNGTATVECAPHASKEISLGSYTAVTEAPEAFLNLSWAPKADAPLIKKGYEVAYDQFTLPGTPAAAPDMTAMKLKGKKGVYTTKNGVDFEVDPATGAITRIYKGRKELLATPITLSLYRPATENDNAGGGGEGPQWREAGIDSLTQTVNGKVEMKKNRVSVNTTITGRTGKNLGTANYTYWVTTEGKLAVECTYTPDTANVSTLARIGLTFRVPNADVPTVTYLGRSGETYPDRRSAGMIGTWTVKPADDFHHYVKPQTAGNHMDIRWVRFDGNCGLTVTSDKVFQFSAYPYCDQLIERALHINELEEDGLLTVHLDAEHDGLGTATCGPAVMEQYRVPLTGTTMLFIFDMK